MKAFLILIFLIKLIPLKGQTVHGVDLADYPAHRATVSQKAAIKWPTNPFKTKVKAIQDGYTSGVINFAGYYVTVL